MLPNHNPQVRLKSRAAGIPQAENFELVDGDIPELAEGEILIRNEYLSVDPAMRGWVSTVPNYSDPVAIGSVMRAPAAGTVIATRNDRFRIGDRVVGMFGWQQYAVVGEPAVMWKVEDGNISLSASLGILGLSGITAYFGLVEAGQPKAKETVVVSTAAGSVGSAVGQIAHILGCRTVGITGGPAKVQLCKELFGFDEAIDYKDGGSLDKAIAGASPKGIDVYFDNTSGTISDAVLRHINVGARIVICGTASVASWDPPPVSARIERQILVKRARMQGILVFDYQARFAEALRQLSAWYKNGQIKDRTDFLDGLESAPDAIAGLYRGENIGKRVIRLPD